MATPQQDQAVPAFAPKPRHWRYLELFLEFASDGKLLSDQKAADALGCSRQTVQSMRHLPGFREWLNDETRKAIRPGMFNAILVRAGRLALQGSIKHMEFYAKYCGPETAGGQNGGTAESGNGVRVWLGVPQPDYSKLSLLDEPEPKAEVPAERPTAPYRLVPDN